MRDDLFVRQPSQSTHRAEGTKRRRQLRAVDPDKLNMVIFSGGMCGSTRLQHSVQEALQAPLANEVIDLRKTTADTAFLSPFLGESQGSQLAVCRGLVSWRVQQLSTGFGDSAGQKKIVLRTWLQSKLGLV